MPTHPANPAITHIDATSTVATTTIDVAASPVTTTMPGSASSIEELHPFVQALITEKGNLARVLETAKYSQPQWTYAWYIGAMLQDQHFAKQVERIRAVLLLEKAFETYHLHPALHLHLLKAFHPAFSEQAIEPNPIDYEEISRQMHPR